MKIRCDFCKEKEASVFCSADEAALCCQCDLNIHSANILSRKHKRFSVINPTSNCSTLQAPPHCDICQEKRGFLFCKEDKAILCIHCDISVHNANADTMNHNRYLLSGSRLSSGQKEEPEIMPESTNGSSNCKCNRVSSDSFKFQEIYENNSSSSSISEYLTNYLPGWHADNFLIDDISTANASLIRTWISTPEFLENSKSNNELKRLSSEVYMVPEFYDVGQMRSSS